MLSGEAQRNRRCRHHRDRLVVDEDRAARHLAEDLQHRVLSEELGDQSRCVRSERVEREHLARRAAGHARSRRVDHLRVGHQRASGPSEGAGDQIADLEQLGERACVRQASAGGTPDQLLPALHPRHGDEVVVADDFEAAGPRQLGSDQPGEGLRRLVVRRAADEVGDRDARQLTRRRRGGQQRGQNQLHGPPPRCNRTADRRLESMAGG